MELKRENIIAVAKDFIGQPYVWGGESVEEGGYDCSGFVYRVLNTAGYQAPRSTSQGYRSLGQKITYEQAQAGDLLYFGGGKATHIAIYAGNGTMYESIGNSKNTKSCPGKGITLSKVSRRRDLIEVRTLFDVSSDARDENSASGNSGSEKSTKSYVVGNTYTLQVELKVRTGAGTNFAAKSHNQLTVDGTKHDKDGDGALDEGTIITCRAIEKNGDDIWIQIPSGWVAAYYKGNVYIK